MTIWGAEVMTARRKVPAQPTVGVIAPGAFADIVVLGANSLDSIDNTRKIERVMKGGQFIRLGYTAGYTRPGFINDSIVRVDGVSVPTTFVNIRTLKARIAPSRDSVGPLLS